MTDLIARLRVCNDNELAPGVCYLRPDGSDYQEVAVVYGEAHDEKRKGCARRLAACWNACSGISTEELESRAAASALGQERDALFGLVNLLLDSAVPIGPMRSRADYPPQLKAAIEALKSSPQGEKGQEEK